MTNMALPPQPIGSSESFMALMDRVSDYAALERPVLVAGERGTGKELIASRLHFLSPRWEQVYVSVNCAAFEADALDHELFGDTFIDGRDDTNGRFFEANGGTLFLDAVDTLPLYLQEKLMHVIEYGQVQATGELYAEDVDVRVVAATSIDLPGAVARGSFRADLLDRLAFHVLTLPPLRARRDDIDTLASLFGRRMAQSLGADSWPGFTAEAQEQLMAHGFPGNIRELKLLVERSTAAAYLEDESLSEPIHRLVLDPFASPFRLGETPAAALPPAVPTRTDGPTPAAPPPDNGVGGGSDSGGGSFTERVTTFERRLLDEALRACQHHQGRTAERLGLTYDQLRGLLKKHGLKR